jgi:hypothetical protein
MTVKTSKSEAHNTRKEVSEGAANLKGEAFAVMLKDHPTWLELSVDDLVKATVVGAAYLSARKVMLAKIEALGAAEEFRQTVLKEVQTVAKALLEAEARIGKLLPKPEVMHSLSGKRNVHVTRGGRAERILPEGISRNRAHQARLLAENPRAIRQVVGRAILKGNIPTKSAVLTEIAHERKSVQRRQAAVDPKTGLTSEQRAYIEVLEQIVAVLPAQRPPGFNPEFIKLALPLIKTIVFRRLDDWRADMGRYGNKSGESFLDEPWQKPPKPDDYYQEMSNKEFRSKMAGGG